MSVLTRKLQTLADIFVLADGRVRGRYESVTIELTSFCNLSCPLCPVAKDQNTLERERETMRREDLERIVELTREHASAYVLSMWGEPLLHKDFFDLLAIVRSVGKPIWISTNLNYAARLAQRMAEIPELKVICSLDGWDPQSYSIYRVGGRFERVRENLSILAQGRCEVYAQFLLNDANRVRRSEMLAFCSEFGIPQPRVMFPEMQQNFKNENNAPVSGTCHQPYIGAYFNSDGYLLPCCVNVKNDLRLPHVSTFSSAEDLRNGPELVAMRRQLAKDKNHYPSCQSCPGTRMSESVSAAAKARLNAFSGLVKRKSTKAAP